MVVRAGDHGGDGGLRAGAGSGGYGDEGRDAAAHLQKPGQLGQGLTGAGHQRRRGLGGVHGTAAAHGHQTVAALTAVQRGGGLHGGRRRVRPDIGEQDIALQLRQHLPEGGIGALAAAGRHQRAADAVLRQQGRDAGKAAGADHRLRPAPRQQPGARTENALVGTIPEMEQIQEKASLRVLYYGG